MAEEGLQKTDNDLIHIGNPIQFDEDEFLSDLEELMIAAYNNRQNIVEMVEKMVSTFHPEGKTPRAIKDSAYSAISRTAS